MPRRHLKRRSRSQARRRLIYHDEILDMGSKVVVIEKVEDIPEKALQKAIMYEKMIYKTDKVDVAAIKQRFIGKYVRVDCE